MYVLKSNDLLYMAKVWIATNDIPKITHKHEHEHDM